MFIFLNIGYLYKKEGEKLVFYDIFCELCKNNNLTPSGAANKIGFNRASVTVWKNSGKPPKSDLLNKIADFFEVSTDYLLGNIEKPSNQDDRELNDYLEMLKNRSECRMLFKLAKGATKEDVEQAVKIIEALRK